MMMVSCHFLYLAIFVAAMCKTAGQEIVHFKSGDSSTLHEALIHSAPRYIMKQLLERYSCIIAIYINLGVNLVLELVYGMS